MTMKRMMTELMILGELSIFSPKGIEMKTEVIEATSVFRDHDRLKQDRYLFNFDTNCNFNDVELNEPIPNLPRPALPLNECPPSKPSSSHKCE